MTADKDELVVLVGKGTKQEFLDLSFANRHGPIAGATGTGKTMTLQILAEGFSNAGVRGSILGVRV